MRIIFMGTPEFGVLPLEHLVLNGFQVVAVYTQPDKPAGRGQKSVPSAVKRLALSLSLPVFEPASFKSPEVVEELRQLQPDAIVVAAYGKILPQAVLDIPPRRCINIHASLLPRHRGAAPIPAAIMAGDGFTGVTIMLMEAGMDTGPMLARAMIQVSPQDTTGSLTGKLSLIGAHLVQDVLVRWFRGEIMPQPQNEAEATYTRPIKKEDGEIDWKREAVDIWRRVRAYSPWPGSYTFWQGKRLKIIEAVPLVQGESREAGRVVALEKTDELEAAFGVQTGKGVLGISSLQLEGKRAMPSAEFLRGYRDFVGSKLGNEV